MDAGIRDIVSNPKVAYRLDLDEPGVAKPARAASSTLTVVGQESRNRARLKAQALREGRIVTHVGTRYDVKQVGSFLTVVGGLTTVVSRERPETAQDILEPQAPDTAGQEEDAALEVAELRAERQRLEEEQQRLAQQIEAASEAERPQVEQRLREIALRLEAIEEELEESGGGAAASAAGVQGPIAAFDAALDAAGQLLDILV